MSGSEVYSVDADKNTTLLGDIGAAINIDMASNVDNLVIVNEPKGYFYDGATFGEITDEDFTTRGAADVEFLNNFLLFREPNSARFFSPDEAGNTLTYNALMFAIADSQPDNMVAMIADHGQLICLGTKTTELFDIQEISGFPFQRIINGEIEQGCLNSKTVAALDNSVYWVAEDFTVRRLEGITPKRVSPNAVEQSIAAATASTAEAFTYVQ